jgi:hypothetical protein
MWQTIDGETLLVLLEQVADTLPQAARIVHHGVQLTVVEYEIWKAKVKRRQDQNRGNEGKERDGPTDD